MYANIISGTGGLQAFITIAEIISALRMPSLLRLNIKDPRPRDRVTTIIKKDAAPPGVSAPAIVQRYAPCWIFMFCPVLAI
jgi:hypothetical protein